MGPFFPFATTESPERPQKRANKIVVTRRAKHVSQGREGGEKASMLPLVFRLPPLEQRGEAEDVVSMNTSL